MTVTYLGRLCNRKRYLASKVLLDPVGVGITQRHRSLRISTVHPRVSGGLGKPFTLTRYKLESAPPIVRKRLNLYRAKSGNFTRPKSDSP